MQVICLSNGCHVENGCGPYEKHMRVIRKVNGKSYGITLTPSVFPFTLRMACIQILNVSHLPFEWLPFGKPFAFGPKVRERHKGRGSPRYVTRGMCPGLIPP
jgi:hypothetical protein